MGRGREKVAHTLAWEIPPSPAGAGENRGHLYRPRPRASSKLVRNDVGDRRIRSPVTSTSNAATFLAR